MDELPRITAISPNETEAIELILDPFEYEFRAVTILNVGRMNDCDQYEPHHVDEQMSFASIDLFARIVAVRPPFSVVLTDWESMTPALGCLCRPAASRTSPRSLS